MKRKEIKEKLDSVPNGTDLFHILNPNGGETSERRRKVVIKTSPEVFVGTTKEKNAMAVYVLISSRYTRKCVYGATRKEIAKKLGVSQYMLSSAISVLKKKGLVAERKTNKGIIVECHGVRNLNRGIKAHLKPLFINSYDSHEVVKNKIFSFTIKHILTCQEHVHQRVETLYRSNDVDEIKKGLKYLKKFGNSYSRMKVIGMRRIATRLGVSIGKAHAKINEMIDSGILGRKKIYEILDGKNNSSFLQNHYYYLNNWKYIQLIGSTYTILNKKLYTTSGGLNPREQG